MAASRSPEGRTNLDAPAGSFVAGRHQQKSLRLVRSGPGVRSTFRSKTPRAAIPIPTQENQIAGILILTESYRIPGQLQAQGFRVRLAVFSATHRGRRFLLGVMPRDLYRPRSDAERPAVSAFNEPSSKRTLLRVIDRFEQSRDGRPVRSRRWKSPLRARPKMRPSGAPLAAGVCVAFAEQLWKRMPIGARRQAASWQASSPRIRRRQSLSLRDIPSQTNASPLGRDLKISRRDSRVAGSDKRQDKDP